MTNHYKFHCPVAQSDELLSDCETRHGKMMQGKYREVEPEICRVAHQCWMCPARSAFRASGGPWAQPANKPRWEEPRDTVAKLPAEITNHAFMHSLPHGMDYMRAGLSEGTQEYTQHLLNLQQRTAGSLPESESPKAATKPSRRGAQKKGRASADKMSNVSAIDSIEKNSYAAAITEAVAEEKKVKAPRKPAPKPSPKPKPSPVPKADKKLSLAERAKLMKARKTG